MNINKFMQRAFFFLLAIVTLASVACNTSIPNRKVSSYTKLQNAFSSIDAVVFPDLSPFGFDEAGITYQLNYSSVEKNSPHGYTIYGVGNCGGCPVESSFSCTDKALECTEIDTPIIYNGVKIKHRSIESGARGEAYFVYINGFEYKASMDYDYGIKLSHEEATDIQITIQNTLYAIICGIIDSAQNNN